MREILGLGPLQRLLAAAQGCHHVQTLATRGLAEGFESDGRQALPDFQRRGDDRCKLHIGRRVQVEDQPSGEFRLIRRAVPGMQFQGTTLCNGDQRFQTIDLQIGLLITANIHWREHA